jgi:hypothetical protein
LVGKGLSVASIDSSPGFDIGLAIALVILAVMAIIGAFILAFVVSQNGVKV